MFDCNTCTHKNCDSDFSRLGSKGPSPYPRWEIVGLGKFNTCLLPMVTKETEWIFRLHRHYENGVLLRSGGLLDQPNYYIEAMELLDSKLVKDTGGQ